MLAISNHIPILHARDDVDLVAAVRRNVDALKDVKAEFGISHMTDDYREALDLDLDAVIVAGPPSLHHEHTHAALTAWANVLCVRSRSQSHPATQPISTDTMRMGQFAAELLIERIHDKSAPPRITTVPTELLVRDSTHPVRT